MAQDLKQIEEGVAKARQQITQIQTGIASLAEMDSSPAPPIDNGAGEITAAGVGITLTGQAKIDAFQKVKDDLLAQQPAPEIEKVKTSIFDLFKKGEEVIAAGKTQIELREEGLQQFFEETGITPEQLQEIGPLIGEVTALNQQLADIEIRKQAALDLISDSAGHTIATSSARQNRVAKAFNSEIAAKGIQAAVKIQELQMLQGAFQDAQNTAAQIVKLATYDQRQEVADIEWSLNAHQDLYNLLSNEEQTQWNRQFAMAQDNLDRATTEWTEKVDMAKDAARQGIKLDINQSLEDLTADFTTRVSEAAKARAAEEPTFAPPELAKEWQLAGGQAGTGMTQFEYIAWRTGLAVDLPRVWSDDELRISISRMKLGTTNNPPIDYEEALNEISLDPSVQNKEKAYEIAAEEYEMIEEPKPGVPGVPSKPTVTRPDFRFQIGPEGGVLLNPLYVE